MKITGVLLTLIALFSIAAAKTRPINRCALKPNPGPCYGAFRRWFFNQKTQKCEPFIWGGCLGVVPFKTKSDCQTKCQKAEDPCKQLPDPGPCEALIESYFFNQKTKKCEKFFWGGCDGTRPFETLEACEKKCGSKELCDLTPKDVLPPPGTITCQLAWTSWYFNKYTGKCESFFYSACGNLGPFETKRECVKAKCKCKLRPQDTKGSACLAYWTTWFYNEDTGKCDKFSYSGCSPIAFRRKKKCQKSCS